MAKPPSSAQETSSPIPTQPTYLLMRYGTTGITSRHTIEIAAIFGMDWGDTANANIVPAVMNYWISFIRSLNPNTYKYASAPQWENLGTGFDGGKRLKFETNATVIETIPADQVQRCKFWRKLVRTMEQWRGKNYVWWSVSNVWAINHIIEESKITQT